MVRLGTLLLTLLGGSLLAPAVGVQGGGASAQETGAPAPLELSVNDESGALTARVGDVLGATEIRDALQSGLPLRIHVRVQLWRDGFFDSQRGQWDWRARVVYDPLDRSYLLEARPVASGRVGPDASPDSAAASDVVEFATFPAIRAGIRRILHPELRPSEEGSYYYLARVEVETLSLSDLEELRRWLSGNLAEAVAGEREVEGAVERGLRRAVVRLLGMPERRYETRTPTFEFGS